jgi:glutamyl-tRNA reductase
LLKEENRKVQGRAVYILRTAIRASFKDVKNNNETSKMCWKFVNKLLHNPTVWLSKSPVNESSGGKRKRTGAQDDTDDEFAPSKKTRGRKATAM